MKKLTKKLWFGKKIIGWGLRPVSWEGWVVTLIFLIVVVLDFVYFRKNTFSITIFILVVIVFVAIAFLTGEKPGSELCDRLRKGKNGKQRVLSSK